MKNNPEDIPSVIFDWLEKKSFSSLNASEQEEVLKYFSEEEYELMYQGVLNIRATVKATDESNHKRRKHELMQQFDAKHAPSKASLSFVSIAWKAAAVFLLLGIGWVSHYLMQGNNTSFMTDKAKVDTIYITKEVASAPVKIFDTVYIEQKAEIPSYNKANYRTDKRNVQRYDVSNILYENTNILSVKEANSKANKQKGNSMKEDSLLRKYTFVSL